MSIRSIAALLAMGSLLMVSACVSWKFPLARNELQMISAGHTGCAPDANEISNANVSSAGNGTWNVACERKKYLCSATFFVDACPVYSCASVKSRENGGLTTLGLRSRR